MSNRPNRKPSKSIPSKKPKASTNKYWWAFGAFLVVVSLFVIAFATSKPKNSNLDNGGVSESQAASLVSIIGGAPFPDGNLVYGNVSVDGEPLPPMPVGGTTHDQAIGKKVPGIVGNTFDKSEIFVPSGGKPRIYLFVAHWCPHCQKEVPLLQDWFVANGVPNDIDIVVVSTGTDESRGNYPPASWLRKEQWPTKILVDDKVGTAAQAFGMNSYPYFVATDGQGVVVKRLAGEITIDQWTALLQSLRL